MRKNIQLHIPEPCHEDWNSMVPVEKGRYCTSCQNQVIDFTNMSDQQLIAYFKKRNKDAICGRFMNDQLQRDILIPKKRIPWLRYFFQFALPALVASSKAASQGQVKIKTGKPVIVTNVKSNELKKEFAGKSSRNVNGKIVDETGSAIPYASVYIKGTSIGTSCDSTGNFSLGCHETGDSIILQFSSVGFKMVESVILLNSDNEHVLITLYKQDVLQEVVVMSTGYARGRFIVGAISVVTNEDVFDEKAFPAEDSWKFYPNPVYRESILRIEPTKVIEGKHMFQLLSSNGQMIMKKEVWIEKNNVPVKLEIPSIPPGVYFLIIANKQYGKNITEKIVVME